MSAITLVYCHTIGLCDRMCKREDKCVFLILPYNVKGEEDMGLAKDRRGRPQEHILQIISEALRTNYAE